MQQALKASGIVTNEAIVAAVTGKRIAVGSVFLSTDTGQTIILESGNSSLRWKQFCAANGGHHASAPDKRFLFETAVGDALTWTTTGGNSFVSVRYEILD